jgi:hypothetical protein
VETKTLMLFFCLGDAALGVPNVGARLASPVKSGKTGLRVETACDAALWRRVDSATARLTPLAQNDES